MTDTIEQLTDNELHCRIRYLWHRLEALRYYPGPKAEHDQEMVGRAATGSTCKRLWCGSG